MCNKYNFKFLNRTINNTMDFSAVYKNVIKPLYMYCEALFQKSERLKKQVEELQVQLEACRKQSKATKEMDSKLCRMIEECIDMEKYNIGDILRKEESENIFQNKLYILYTVELIKKNKRIAAVAKCTKPHLWIVVTRIRNLIAHCNEFDFNYNECVRQIERLLLPPLSAKELQYQKKMVEMGYDITKTTRIVINATFDTDFNANKLLELINEIDE